MLTLTLQISSLPTDDIPLNLISHDLEKADYAFQGDIIQVCDMILPFFSLKTNTPSKLKFIDGDVDEKTSPYIAVTDVVSSFQTSDHSFDMSPSQYTALTHTSSPLPIHGHFIESKRWGEGKKPKLFNGSSVSFGGFVDRIHRERDLNRTLSQVEVEVLTVSFIPTQAGFTTMTTSSAHRKCLTLFIYLHSH